MSQSKLKPKYLRVLSALEKGAEVKLFGQTVVLGEDPTSKATKLSYKVRVFSTTADGLNYQDNQGDEMLFSLDVSLNDFIRECEALDEVDIPIVIQQ